LNLKKGRYGVTTSAGKDYKSRVEEGSDRLGNLLQADPALMPILGPNWMHFQDFPGHEEAEKILRKMRDQQFPWLKDDVEQPDAGQQLQQAKAQLQKLEQEFQKAVQAIQTDQAKQQATIAKAKIDADTKIKIEQVNAMLALKLQAMKDATTITAEQIKALVAGVRMDSEALNEAQAVGHEAEQGRQTRAHDLASMVQQHAHSLEAAQQGHAQAVAQAEQGQDHALESQEQAAELAPEPVEAEA
jgi:hypothetical protein